MSKGSQWATYTNAAGTFSGLEVLPGHILTYDIGQACTRCSCGASVSDQMVGDPERKSWCDGMKQLKKEQQG